MTAATLSRSGLRSLSWDALAQLMRDGDDTVIPAVVAEGKRRDRLEQQQRARDTERSAWREAAHAQYLAADAVCRGNLVNRAGCRAGVTDWSLWSGPESRAMKYATEELREFWYENARVTVGEYQRQARECRIVQRADSQEVSVPAAATWRETTVTVGSWPRAAWWVIRDGRAVLYLDRDAAVSALVKA